jgi:hypothetical protein
VDQAEFIKTVVSLLESQDTCYMIVGSLVSSQLGNARYTYDVDIVIDVDESQVLKLCEAFPTESYYWSRQAALEAVRTRRQFNIIHNTSGNKVDFMIARQNPWSRMELSRRTRRNIAPNCLAYTASASDVILAKMVFFKEGGSDKHLRDITGMLQVSGSEIDRGYIEEWAERLELSGIWQMILKKLDQEAD